MIKAVVVGEFKNPSASGIQRLWALRRCGVDVYPIELADFPSILGAYGGVVSRLLRAPRLTRAAARLEAAVATACDHYGPDFIWLEWPRTYRPEFLESLRAKGVTLISFVDDNPDGERRGDAWQWRDYLRCIPSFDHHIVKRAGDIGFLVARGAKNCCLWMHGVYPPLYFPDPAVEKIYPVSFVGTCMDDRAKFLEALVAGAGLPVHVFGPRWETRSMLPKRFPQFFHGPVYGEAYADVLRASSLALGFVSHSNRDEWTMRSYEVPACGTALLAERTPTHVSWFEEGREALFFSDARECVAKIRWALENPSACRAIGTAGLRKFEEQGWTIDRRMAELLAELFPVSGSTR